MEILILEWDDRIIQSSLSMQMSIKGVRGVMGVRGVRVQEVQGV